MTKKKSTPASSGKGKGKSTAGKGGRPWTCPYCGDLNPPNIGACLTCGTPRPRS
jgi:hypothetical protein